MTINIATYRNSMAHLLDLLKFDYSTCISLAELRSWRAVTERALAELLCAECKRVTAADRRQYRQCLKAVRARLVVAQERIKKMEQAAPCVKPSHSLPRRQLRCLSCDSGSGR